MYECIGKTTCNATHDLKHSASVVGDVLQNIYRVFEAGVLVYFVIVARECLSLASFPEECWRTEALVAITCTETLSPRKTGFISAVENIYSMKETKNVMIVVDDDII